MADDKFTKLISFEKQGELFDCLIEFDDGTQMHKYEEEAGLKTLQFEQAIWKLRVRREDCRKLLRQFRETLELNREEAYNEGHWNGQDSMEEFNEEDK